MSGPGSGRPAGSFRPTAHEHHELIAGLEPDQVVAHAARPFGRYRMGRATAACFWALRVFVLLMAVLVAYTFFASLPD